MSGLSKFEPETRMDEIARILADAMLRRNNRKAAKSSEKETLRAGQVGKAKPVCVTERR